MISLAAARMEGNARMTDLEGAQGHSQVKKPKAALWTRWECVDGEFFVRTDSCSSCGHLRCIACEIGYYYDVGTMQSESI